MQKEVFWKLSVCIWSRQRPHTYRSTTSRARQVGLAWGRLGQAAGSSDTDGKLRLHVLAKPSFWGFFLLWLLLRWLSKGKRSLSFCLGAWVIDAWLAAWLWDCLAPVGTLTPPQAPRSAKSEQGFILPRSAHPCRALASSPSSCTRRGCCWAEGSGLPWVPAHGAEPASLLPSCFWGHCCCSLVLAVAPQLTVQHCCTVKHSTDLSIFSSRSCFLA